MIVTPRAKKTEPAPKRPVTLMVRPFVTASRDETVG